MGKPHDYEIEKVLVLSTAHIPLKDNELLENEKRAGVVAYAYKYGHYVYVGTNKDVFEQVLESAKQDGFSYAFVKLLELAHSLDCPYLKLDCDGPIRKELLQFDWSNHE